MLAAGSIYHSDHMETAGYKPFSGRTFIYSLIHSSSLATGGLHEIVPDEGIETQKTRPKTLVDLSFHLLTLIHH